MSISAISFFTWLKISYRKAGDVLRIIKLERNLFFRREATNISHGNKTVMETCTLAHILLRNRKKHLARPILTADKLYHRSRMGCVSCKEYFQTCFWNSLTYAPGGVQLIVSQTCAFISLGFPGIFISTGLLNIKQVINCKWGISLWMMSVVFVQRSGLV